MFKKVLTVLITLTVMAMPSLAISAPKVNISSKAEVEVKVINAKGEVEIKRIKASEADVVPGDIVIFTTEFSNDGDAATDPGLVLTNHISGHMAYVGGSAVGKETVITFSVDGGKSYDVPARLRVKDKDGTMRKALPEEYTHIRWTIADPLKPSGEGRVGFRAKVK